MQIDYGMSKSAASRVFKVSRTAIHNWTKARADQGTKALKAKKRGPRASSRLLPHQAATAVRLIEQKCPDDERITVLFMDSRSSTTVSGRAF
jgi:transposase